MTCPFSILERIDDVVTRLGVGLISPFTSFSILERIDDVVTYDLLDHRLDHRLCFQYPRTDRRCCDTTR